MTVRSIRARVHAGRIETLEAVTLPEGTNVTVVVDLPDAQGELKPGSLRGRFPQLLKLSDDDLAAARASWTAGAVKELETLRIKAT